MRLRGFDVPVLPPERPPKIRRLDVGETLPLPTGGRVLALSDAPCPPPLFDCDNWRLVLPVLSRMRRK